MNTINTKMVDLGAFALILFVFLLAPASTTYAGASARNLVFVFVMASGGFLMGLFARLSDPDPGRWWAAFVAFRLIVALASGAILLASTNISTAIVSVLAVSSVAFGNDLAYLARHFLSKASA